MRGELLYVVQRGNSTASGDNGLTYDIIKLLLGQEKRRFRFVHYVL